MNDDLSAMRPLADHGDAGAKFNLGAAYFTGDGIEQDHEQAVDWWRLAAEQGMADWHLKKDLFLQF